MYSYDVQYGPVRRPAPLAVAGAERARDSLDGALALPQLRQRARLCLPRALLRDSVSEANAEHTPYNERRRPRRLHLSAFPLFSPLTVVLYIYISPSLSIFIHSYNFLLSIL